MTETHTPATEIQRAEGQMSLKQKLMSDARAQVLLAEADLLTAGVDKKVIEKAADIAGERVKQDYEDREKQDPLVQIEQSFIRAAQSHNDGRLVAQELGLGIERTRFELTQRIKGAKAEQLSLNQPFDIKEYLLSRADIPRDGTQDAKDLNQYISGNLILDDRAGELYLGIRVKNPIPGLTDPTHGKIRGGFNELDYWSAALSNLGALSSGETPMTLYNQLRRAGDSDLSSGTEIRNGPIYYSYGHAMTQLELHRMPTVHEGIDLTFNLMSRDLRLNLSMTALQKTLQFPPPSVDK